MTQAQHAFLSHYFQTYRELAFTDEVGPLIAQFAELASQVRDRGRKLIFAGNGASASLAEHGAVDFTKQGKTRAVTFHDTNLITCFANDYGYDHWMAKALEHHADDGDAVVLISVSGRSPSVVNAAKYAHANNLPVVAFTGRDTGSPLAQGALINFHVESHAYNIVECIHAIWLTATIDYLIGSAVYETRADDTDPAG